MESDDKEQVILRQYLLGELSAESCQRVEERLLTDGDFLEELSITEEELIDQYLSGELAAPETGRFEAYFLAIPERRRKLAFARAFKKYVAVAADIEVPKFKPAPPPRRRIFPAILNFRNPLVSYSLAAALLLLIGVAAWQIIKSGRLKNPSEMHVITVVLTPGAVRAEGEMKRLTLPPQTDAVNLQLEIAQGDYQSYRAILLTDEGREAFTQTDLKAQTVNNSRVISFTIPAKNLSRGDYQVKLSGQSSANEPEEIASYTFRVSQ
jgi:hypothetical protein